MLWLVALAILVAGCSDESTSSPSVQTLGASSGVCFSGGGSWGIFSNSFGFAQVGLAGKASRESKELRVRFRGPPILVVPWSESGREKPIDGWMRLELRDRDVRIQEFSKRIQIGLPYKRVRDPSLRTDGTYSLPNIDNERGENVSSLVTFTIGTAVVTGTTTLKLHKKIGDRKIELICGVTGDFPK